jgi:NTE family protein
MKRFGLVLSGGGARGLAHVGVLRALDHLGCTPGVIVGVSMGAIVGAAYALNNRWYDELVGLDAAEFPVMPDFSRPGAIGLIRTVLTARETISGMYFGWGVSEAAVKWGRGLLSSLTRGKRLEDGRVPVFVSATDIETGKRAVLSEGSASDAIYASSAIAGVLPPLQLGDLLLIDGGYSDMAPVDIARDAGAEQVIAVDASTTDVAPPPQNGLQAMLRSIEICQNEHSLLRIKRADLVLKPKFAHHIGALDFQHFRSSIAAGARITLASRGAIQRLLV